MSLESRMRADIGRMLSLCEEKRDTAAFKKVACLYQMRVSAPALVRY